MKKGDDSGLTAGEKVLVLSKVTGEFRDAIIINPLLDGDLEVKLCYCAGTDAGRNCWAVPANIKPYAYIIDCSKLDKVFEDTALLPGDVIIRNIPVGNKPDLVPLMVMDVNSINIYCFHLTDARAVNLTREYMFSQGETYFLHNLDSVFNGFEFKAV